MSIQSQTPETDEFRFRIRESYGDSPFVDAVCVDELLIAHERIERERNDLRRLVKKLEGQLTSALNEIVKAHDSKQPTSETPDKHDI